jgi:outer membrane receptor protein involved in Fe transport
MTRHPFDPVRPGFFRISLLAAFLLVGMPGAASAADETPAFDLPAGNARVVLRQFASQAGREIVFAVETVDGVQTNAVKGVMTPREAIDQMLDATGLVAAQDEKTGAFAVSRHGSDTRDGPNRTGAVPPPARRAAPAPVTPAGAAADEEIVMLSPFVVDAAEDEGYAAKSTLAGTRIRTELKDVGSSISVITKQFLEDTNSTNIESLLVYTANTEVSGEGGNFLGKGDGAILTSHPGTTTRVRGLTSADGTRDFYLSDIQFDSYNTGRIDIQRGPNAVLFGIGSPAGIINASISTAAFKDANKLSFQFGSYGTHRSTADFNRVIVKDELAVRLSLLNEARKYRQDPAFRDDQRVFAAVRWQPRFLAKGSARTTLRVNFEKGEMARVSD